MSKILVTGGGGYIGSHTMVDLINNGYEVISIDNLSRGFMGLITGAGQITGKPIKNYKVDLCNLNDTGAVFEENKDIAGIIHFAAFKTVPESVQAPLSYFNNNINSLLNILQCAQEYNIPNIVFSSSCSVYGNTKQLPVKEETPFLEAESPYARTKQMGEQICKDFSRAYPLHNLILLRYFNPVGAHPSSLIGELNEQPENLVPVITQTAVGKRPSMTVFGSDYPTRDGSCIRDYIHVMDIAHAHTLAMNRSRESALADNCSVFNLGTGKGITVLELIAAFERISGRKLNVVMGPRRAGDVIEIYANNTRAKEELGWVPQHDIDEMMRTAWKWEKRLDEATKAFLN
jgi:UDP-glucose 4-epimerase